MSAAAEVEAEGATTFEQLALEGRAIGLRGAATELLDEEARHLEPRH